MNNIIVNLYNYIFIDVCHFYEKMYKILHFFLLYTHWVWAYNIVTISIIK